MPDFSLIEGDLKFRLVFTCGTCGRRNAGDTQRLHVVGHSPSDIASALSALRPRSAEMPVGWAFDGRFTCGPCMTE